MVARSGCLLCCLGLSTVLFHLLVGLAASARAPLPVRTRTYQFTARITDNEGVTAFKVGELIKGTFTYEVGGGNLRPDVEGFGRYQSKRNSLAFQYGDLRFSGVGDILASVSMFHDSEHFRVEAPDLQLPKGWEMDHTRRSQSYAVSLQNAPPRKVIRSTALPDKLSLSEFVDTREFRLDFVEGVRFPGGQVKGRAIVNASVESLEEVSR
jgi:hypothetical protein